MADEWIKMRRNLLNHPKVVRITSALLADKFRTVGGLHAVWSVFDEFSEDGKLNGYSLSAMDITIGWPGFCEAMAAVGWLIQEGQTLVVPEFDEHNGSSGKRRSQESKRKRDVRNVSATNADKNRTKSALEVEVERESLDQKKELPLLSPKKTKAERGVRLPSDWQPSAPLIAQVFEIGGSALWRTELPRFVDYWTSQPGQRGVKLDWDATFRNWIRKAVEQTSTQRQRQQQPSRQAAIAQALIEDPRYANTASRQSGLALPDHRARPADAHAALTAVSAGPGHDPGDRDGLDDGHAAGWTD